MKHEEVLIQSRLTPEPPRSYARSMHDQVESQDISAPTSDERLQELVANGDKTYKAKVNQIQQENSQAVVGRDGVNADKETTSSETTQQADAATPTTDASDKLTDLTEASPKGSLLGAILSVFKGTLTDEKLVKRVDTFTKSYDSLKTASLNELKEEYQSWNPPDNKNDPQKVVYIVVQKYIAQLVADRNEVSLSVFLQAANADRNINVSEVLAQSTNGASTGVEKAMQRFMVAMDEKPIEEWSTKDLAEELVEFNKAVVVDGGNGMDTQVKKVVEDFVIDKVEEAGVSKEAFAKVVTQVEAEREDALIAQVPDRTLAQPIAPVEAEDRVIDVQPAVAHDTVHSFESQPTLPHPDTLSYGNDPELARVMWRAYNGDKDLTAEQQVLASRGYMPGGKDARPELSVPPGGNVVPIRREAERVDDELETTSTARVSSVVELSEMADDDEVDSLSVMDVDRTKEKIGKDWGDLEVFFKSKANGALGLLIDKAKSDIHKQEQITSFFNAQKAEILSLKNEGKLEDAQKMAAELVDQLNGAYGQLDNESRAARVPRGRFEAGRGRRGEALPGDPDWLERNQFQQVNATSMNEFAFVIGLDQAKYAKGGERQIIDKDNNFLEENFMYWVQENFLNYHNSDPDNPQRFFDLIKIDHPEMSGVVSINTIVNSSPDKYTKLKVLDEDNSKRNPLYKNEIDTPNEKKWEEVNYKFVPLAETHAYLTDFVWLVGSIRNASAEYILQQSDDNKIGELIASVMKSNVLTKRSAGKENTLEAVATLTSKFRDWGNIPRIVTEIKEKSHGATILNPNDIVLSKDALEKLKRDPAKQAEYRRKEEATRIYLAEGEKIKAEEQNIDVGDGVAVGYLMYYNIADYDYLHKKFGQGDGKTNLFTKQGMDAVLNKLAKISSTDSLVAKNAKIANYLSRASLIKPIEGKTATEIEEMRKEWFEKMYGTTNNVINKKAFIDLLNIFVPPQKNANQTDMANRLIQLVVGERLALHDPVLQKKPLNERLDEIMDDSHNEFAMLIAQFMTPFTGAAAKGDTGVNAVNAAAKMRWIDYYKKKQGENTRAGGFGNLYNLGTIRSSYVDMMIGMPTVNGKNIIEVFEEKDEALRTNATFDERSRISKQLLFNLNDAKQYGAAHTGNAIKIFHQEIEGKEIDFHKFIHVDPLTGHISYKPDAMLDALQDAIIKPTRYAWSTNRVPFHKIVRIMEDNKKEPPIFRTGTQLEDMFSPQVLKVIEKTFINGNKNNPKFIESYGEPISFLTSDGKVKRYAVNSAGKFIDNKGNEIKIDSKDKSYAWRSQLVLDMSEDGQIDPAMEAQWQQTDFRRCVVKGYLINRFAGQLYGHTTSHSPYEKLDYGLREDIIRGLMQIPVDPDDHDGNFEGKHIGGSYFTKDDIKMLRNLSKNQLWRNIPLALGADLRNGLFSAFTEYFSRIMKASTAGV